MYHARKLAALFLVLIAAQLAQAARPNIIFIMSDDHSYQAMGIYGSRLAALNPTPNLDRFARSAVVFDNVFCTNSICTPSRASIMTGQYSQRNGVLDLYAGLPGDRHYLSREMQRAGHTTAIVGKWHLKESPRFFDFYSVIPGQGRYMNPVLHVSEGGTVRKVRYNSTLTREIAVKDYQGHSSDVLTDITLDWLKHRDRSKPFFLMHHFKAPHDMFVYAPRYEDYLKDATIPEPTSLYDQPGPKFGSLATRGENDSLVGVIGSTVSPQPKKRNLASYYRKQIRQLTGKETLTDREMTHHTYQLYLKEYLRCVKGIDDNLQRLLDYCRQEGLLENTIIVYTSDQGMMLGEHDYIDKRWMYEESLRMPLIVHMPDGDAAGRRCDWLINNTDFAPTLLAAAGVDAPSYMQGRSFLPALSGAKEPDDWRRSTYYRYWMHMAHGHNNPAHFGIRSKRYKLIFFYGADFTNVHGGRPVEGREGNRYWKNTPAAWEFYDLEQDPHEMHNLYGDPAHAELIAQLKQELRETRKALGENDAQYPRIQAIIDAHWDD
jgi:uncharacterized sulfatase